MVKDKRRPQLTKEISLQDFQNFYWLKEELVLFCRTMDIGHSGGKIEISERIKRYLTTGEIKKSGKSIKQKSLSKFNWNKESLSLSTILTDNYRNTENVRAFMIQQIGRHFHFTVDFMNWTKQNVGKTLAEAITEWKRLYELRKGRTCKPEIALQFEYNQYIRDFMANNPQKSMKDAIKCWKLKKQQQGSRKYCPSDLEM